MIAQVRGTLIAKDLDRVELLTAGGVAYELTVPLGTYETLPKVGEPLTLHTHLVVRDDGWQLFGFATPYEKRVFARVLSAQGIGPSLAMGMLSALSADRLVRAIREKDIPTLQGVPRVGRKKAERLILDLGDKLDELQGDGGARGPRPDGAHADDAIRALVSLGYSASDAEKAVRKAIDDGPKGLSAPELIRVALGKVGDRS
ncbi:MAG: Holliday junction branch migration protein RuvA [Gemmatimonadaceae bacterium]